MPAKKTTPKRARASAPAKGAKSVKVAAKAAGKRPPAKATAAKSKAKAPAKVAAKPKATAKRAAARATSSARASKPAGKASKAVKPAKAAPRAAAARVAKPVRRAAKPVKRGRGSPVVPAERVVRIRALDPFARCGPDTSVEQLFRVDESLDGRPTVHLVYLDRHGWYCFHGRGCPAVRDVHRELRIPAHVAGSANTALRARA